MSSQADLLPAMIPGFIYERQPLGLRAGRRLLRRGRFLMAVLALLTAGLFTGSNSSVAVADEIAPFGYPLAAGTFANAMTTGPDGNLWFTGTNNFTGELTVGKMTPTGEATEYSSGVGGSVSGSQGSLVSGPDGNLWFVEGAADAIGRSNTEGEITSFPLPERASRPTAITVGVDNNLWFTEGAASLVGRITVAGAITEFELPHGSHPSDIVAGPDGNLWFTQRGTDRIGRITVSGDIAEFPIPGRRSKPSAITVGPDGNVWFAEAGVPAIGRITPQGQISQFFVPTATGTDSIVAGTDGHLWFSSRNEVGAIDTAGTVSWPSCLVRFCQYPPAALAVGPDGGLWISAGAGHCPSICGGGSEISYLYRPGAIGAYELLPPGVAIGPRTAPIRRQVSSILVACGLPEGCAGRLRLGIVWYPGGNKRFKVLARGHYELKPSTMRRVRIRVSRWAVRYLHKIRSNFLYVRAFAGPRKRVEAQRGAIKLRLANSARRR